MQIARAVILATPSARDTPWSCTGSGPKPLMPVATKPILFHTLEALRAAGVLEVALLTEPRTAATYEAAVGDGDSWGMRIGYTQCAADTDAGGALRVAADFVDGEPVLVLPADAMLRERLREHVVQFARDDLDALALMLRRPRPRPRPRSAEPLPRLPGGYLLSSRAVSLMRGGPPGRDPLACLRHHGGNVRVLDVDGCLACHGGEASLLEANRLALGSIVTDVDRALEGCETQGPVAIHLSAKLTNTFVRGPAIIGARSRLVDAYVGPYTSIGADARIEGAEIEHSIVMDGAQLLFVGSRMESSIIGRAASVVRRFDMPSAMRVSIGDGAHVALS
ncbi:MAG: glucose-phosphate thymidylyltransferase [Solirubrobacteraceae bacterium]|jgi:glucose-1-phosphate thymidylyltransferase|nr:glucose-phosphate thymidylyltransferase [Solirubrobacteraceae bacterium]